MIDFANAAGRPLNWNVLTVDSHDPERYRNQLAAMDRCREAGAEVVALTMPILVGMNMSFLTYCALNMMPDWGPILGLRPVARLACLRDPDVAPLHGGPRRVARGRRVRPPHRLGPLRHRRHVRRPVAARSARRRPRGRTRRRRRSTPCSTSWSPTTCAPCSGPARPTTTTRAGDCGPRPGSTRSVMIGGSDAGAHLDRMCGPAVHDAVDRRLPPWPASSPRWSGRCSTSPTRRPACSA